MLTETQRAEKNARLFEKVVAKLNDVQVIGTYVSMKDEADTKAIIRWCFENGRTVAVPKVTGSTLTFHVIESFDDLKAGAFGVQEPFKDRPVACEDIGFMIVPLSAFDCRNNRTGYGRGYYDSVLKRCPHTAGLAYAEQMSELIITDPWDVPLDEIIAQ